MLWSGGGECLKWWSGRRTASGGCPAEVRASSGGPTEQRRQAMVQWWSSGATASGSGPAKVRASSGGPTEQRRQAVVRRR
ncbi:hypothetical protein MA16_Dca005438 [Dendrobium catenatum]|uniref:Uncharacterized protein n=1 Tax=Dendrobium catenatum TaxID=906689 RepID=A0A2I0X3E7_9ASPA|nr:hypothetical protein MA16_Dca005438 [Dendrobium catenatum]